MLRILGCKHTMLVCPLVSLGPCSKALPIIKKEKWYFPLGVVLSKCVEKLSKCDLLFFLGFEIKKMEAEILFQV